MTEINIVVPKDSKANNEEENETLIVNEDHFEQKDSEESEDKEIISNEGQENECSFSVNQNENKTKEKNKKEKIKKNSKNKSKKKRLSNKKNEKKKETKINSKNQKKSKITKLSDYYVNYLYSNSKQKNISNTNNIKHKEDFANKINFDSLFNIQNQNNNLKSSSLKVLNTEKTSANKNPNDFINRLKNYDKQQKEKLLYASSGFAKLYRRDSENSFKKIESPKNSKKNFMKTAHIGNNMNKNILSNELKHKFNKKIDLYSKSPKRENKNIYNNNYFKRSASPKVNRSSKEKYGLNKKKDFNAFNNKNNEVPYNKDLKVTEIRAKNPVKDNRLFNINNSKNKVTNKEKRNINKNNNNLIIRNDKKDPLIKTQKKNKVIQNKKEENREKKGLVQSKKDIKKRIKSQNSSKDKSKKSRSKTPHKKTNNNKEIFINRNINKIQNKFNNSKMKNERKIAVKSDEIQNKNNLSPIPTNNNQNKFYYSSSRSPKSTKNSFSQEKSKSSKKINNLKNEILLVNKINNQINEILSSKANDYSLFNSNNKICFLGFCDVLFDMGFLHIKESSIEDITKLEKNLENVIIQPYTNRNTLSKEFLFNEQMLLISAWKTIKNNFILCSKLEKLPKDNEEISIEDLKLFILIVTGLYNGNKNNLQVSNDENNSIINVNNTNENTSNEVSLNKNKKNNLDKSRLSEKNMNIQYNELIKKIEKGRKINNKMIQKIKHHFNYFNELRKLKALHQKEIKDNTKTNKSFINEYSFRPKINKNNKILITKFSPSMDFFQRSEIIKKRNAQKKSKLERARSEELFKECTFNPITNKTKLSFSKSKDNSNFNDSSNYTPINKTKKNESKKNSIPFSDSKANLSPKNKIKNNENEINDKNNSKNKENKLNNLHRGLKKSMFLKSPLSKDEFLNKRISKLRDNNFKKELNLYESNRREVLSNDVKNNIQKLKNILDSDKGLMRMDIEKKTNKDTFEKYKNPKFNDYNVVIFDDCGNEPLFTVEIKIKNIKRNIVVYPNNNLEKLINEFCVANKLGKVSYDKIYQVIKNKMDEMKMTNIMNYGIKSGEKENFDIDNKKNNSKNNSYNNDNSIYSNGNNKNSYNNKKINRNNKLTNSPVRCNKEEEQKCNNIEEADNVKKNISNENFHSYIKLYEDDKNEPEIEQNIEVNGDKIQK